MFVDLSLQPEAYVSTDLENTPTSPAPGKKADKPRLSVPIILMTAGLTLALVVWFYGFVPSFGSYDHLSLFGWLMSAWNGETGLEHGVCMPIMILGLIAYRFRDLRDAVLRDRVSYFGLIAVFAGALLYAVSYRLFLPRISVCGLPILLWGACHWGLANTRLRKGVQQPDLCPLASADDLRRLVLCGKNQDVAEGFAFSLGNTARHPRQRTPVDVDLGDCPERRSQMGDDHLV